MPWAFAQAPVKGFANVVAWVVLVVAGRLDVGYCRNKMYLVLNWVTGDKSGSPVLSVAVERFGMGIAGL